MEQGKGRGRGAKCRAPKSLSVTVTVEKENYNPFTDANPSYCEVREVFVDSRMKLLSFYEDYRPPYLYDTILL